MLLDSFMLLNSKIPNKVFSCNPFVYCSMQMTAICQLNGPIIEQRNTLQNRSFYQTFFINH